MRQELGWNEKSPFFWDILLARFVFWYTSSSIQVVFVLVFLSLNVSETARPFSPVLSAAIVCAAQSELASGNFTYITAKTFLAFLVKVFCVLQVKCIATLDLQSKPYYIYTHGLSCTNEDTTIDWQHQGHCNASPPSSTWSLSSVAHLLTHS